MQYMQGKMFRLVIVLSVLVAAAVCELEKPVDYSGHKVITVYPVRESDLDLLHRLREDYGVDLWNEPKVVGIPVMVRVSPDLANAVKLAFLRNKIRHDITIHDVQSAIAAERIQHAVTNYTQAAASTFDYGKYNQYNDVVACLKDLAEKYPKIATLETIGNSYENRPIYAMKISSGASSSTKPAILMECGIHAREWSSVAAGMYLVKELITKYGSDETITALVNKYDYYIINEANPDGYLYTWTQDRLWRKTRSRSSTDWLGICLGVDANRNFDVEHCGVGTSRKPCDDIFCGDKPFSESESRAIRDKMINLHDRLELYVSIHAFSQLWMTPYGTTKQLPPNYSQLHRIGTVGAAALAKRYGTKYRVGSIANIIYEAAGSSVDYAYIKQNIKMAYALELRDTGRYGFFLPKEQILPMCEETFDGLVATINALETAKASPKEGC